MSRFTIIIFCFISFAGKSCPIDNRTIKELTLNAEQIFQGAVTQIHWSSYEEFMKVQVSEGGERILLRDKYSFTAIPLQIFKGNQEVPSTMLGGGCFGFNVEGRKEYIFFTFKDSDKNAAIEVSELTEKELFSVRTANKSLKQDK